MNKQEMKRERRTEMLKAKEDKAERQLSPGLCPEFSAEVPGQNPPLEGKLEIPREHFMQRWDQ